MCEILNFTECARHGKSMIDKKCKHSYPNGINSSTSTKTRGTKFANPCKKDAVHIPHVKVIQEFDSRF
jgi:hypothetical protein